MKLGLRLATIVLADPLDAKWIYLIDGVGRASGALGISTFSIVLRRRLQCTDIVRSFERILRFIIVPVRKSLASEGHFYRTMGATQIIAFHEQ